MITEIRLIERAYEPPFVTVRRAFDVEHNLTGRTYTPSYKVLSNLRPLLRQMEIDFDFTAGVTTARRKVQETPK